MPGNRVTREQIEMIACRYAWAAERAMGRDVLEVACGPGLGLSLLADRARHLVAGDSDAECLRVCNARHQGHVPLLRLDAQTLPFAGACFDVVVMFEAIYYVPDPGRFLTECRRVLRSGGSLLLALPNKHWPGFNPSPESHAYFSPPELAELCGQHGFSVAVFGTYPQDRLTTAQRMLGVARQVSTKLGLVPRDRGRTEAIRSFLKRVNPCGEKPVDG